MCSRYSLDKETITIRTQFSGEKTFHVRMRFNVAPTQQMPVLLLENGAVVLKEKHFGLYPKWAKDRRQPVINARAETLADKPMFKEAFRSRRCLVPASGFYEWADSPTGKLPWRFVLKSGKAFCFAGLFDRWIDPAHKQEVTDFDDEPPASMVTESFAIITVLPNKLVAGVHDRMPAILQPEHYDWWLNPDLAMYPSTLQPFPSELMRAYRVSTIVNNSRNESPECLKAI